MQTNEVLRKAITCAAQSYRLNYSSQELPELSPSFGLVYPPLCT